GIGAGLSAFGLYDGMAELSGWAPTVAVLAGTVLSGNAALALMADVVIATRASEMGMWAPGAQGPFTRTVEEHEAVGDVDIVVDDEAAAVGAVKTYLSYQRDLPVGAPAAGAEAIGSLVPDNRRRPYDMRKIVAAFADDG